MEKNGKNLICPICDKKFYVKKSQLKRRKYCSVNCRNKSYIGKKHSEEHKLKISKSNLGKKRPWAKKNSPFIIGHKIRNTGKTLFKKGKISWNYIDGRSKNCSPARYGDDWDKIRLLIYKRDNFTCQKCGITMNETKKAHHIHHIIPFLQTLDNSLKNLVTLCPSCHRKIETQIMRNLKKRNEEVQSFGRF